MKTKMMTAAIAAMVLSAGMAAAGDPVCGDVNNSGTVTSSDALLVLKKSVQQPVTLNCSAYDNQLATCQNNLSTTNADLSTCNGNLATCDANLAKCESECSGASHLVINEIDYDEVGSDAGEFVEIYNGTGSAVSLANLGLVFVNGSNSTGYLNVSLAPAASLASGQYLVVGTGTVVATVPTGTPTIEFALAADNIQNGSPDGVVLLDTVASTIIDALSYEGSITAATLTGVPGLVNLVEGTPVSAEDSNTIAGSLARLPNGSDTNNASVDWSFAGTATPGEANIQ